MEENQNEPLISIVILNYNGKGYLEECIESVLNTDYPNFEVIIVDNASTDNSVELVKTIFGKDLRLKIIRNDKNLFYADGNNTGIKNSNGEYVVILNNDTRVDKNWLKEIAKGMKDKNIGAAQPKIMIYGDSSKIDNVGGVIDRLGYALGKGRNEIDSGQYNKKEEIFFASGTAMILRKEILSKVGIFDSKFVVHWEDVDLSWRIRLEGYKIFLIPKAVIYHKRSKTIKKYGDNFKISFHIRKNRISGLIKNYSGENLIKILPILVFIYFLIFIEELIVEKNIKLALSSIWAITWNIKELSYILKQRKIVQSKIRKISDKQIIKFMEKGVVAFKCFKGG